MTTIEQRPPQVIGDHWAAALKYYAIGRTAEGFRAEAADPEWVRGMALEGGITEDEERETLLAVADRIDALAAAGLTPVKCWYLAGLDQFLGPYAAARAQDAPRSAAELGRLRDSVILLEECDMQAGGGPSEATKTVRAAYEHARGGAS